MTGTMYLDVSDSSRKELLGAKSGNRRVPLRVYYPSEKGTQKCMYLTPGKRKEFGKKPDFTLYDSRI